MKTLCAMTYAPLRCLEIRRSNCARNSELVKVYAFDVPHGIQLMGFRHYRLALLALSKLTLNPRLASLSRRGRRTFLDLIAKLHNPQSRVDVVEINQAVVRLRAPGERKIRAIAFDVAGPNSANLAALAIEVAAQFAGDIDDATAATVVAHVHDSIFDPHVVRAAFRHGILGDFLRMIN